MEMKSKFFDELTITELYEILRSRSEIFVVEQNCIYQDIDGLDYRSLHVFYEEDGRVMACLRAFTREEGTVQIGRVLTLKHGKGYGERLLREGIQEVRKKLGPQRIVIEAQCYAIGFYEKAGFHVCSGEYLEDGIPHVGMQLDF